MTNALIPAAKKKPPRDRFDLRIEPALLARIQAQADRLNISASAYIRSAVVMRVEADEGNEPPPKPPPAPK